MTGAASRRRGADAERAVVAWLRAHGHPDARRRLAGNGQAGDIDGIPGLVIEVKDVANSAWPSWCRQAAAEAGGTPWVVVRRTRGEPDVGQWPCVASGPVTPIDPYDHPLQVSLAVRAAQDWPVPLWWLCTPNPVGGPPHWWAGRFAWLFDPEETRP